MFGGASLVLTGGFALAASKEEEVEIGDALAECLDTLPAPIGDAISKGGPWLRLGSRLGASVLSRMALVRQSQMLAVQQRKYPQGVPPTNGGPATQTATADVMAPDPSKASMGVPQAASPWDVVAPEPVSI